MDAVNLFSAKHRKHGGERGNKMTEERSESAAGLSFKMGEALLRNGAEIFRVQETMERVRAPTT